MVLIRFMMILVPIVFIASGLTKGNWLEAFLFSLSVAVGLTPELLPMVVSACLAKGSYSMGRKQTIVKNINAMEELNAARAELNKTTGEKSVTQKMFRAI